MKYIIVIIMFFADPLYQGNDAVEVETYNGMPLHFETEQECSAHVNDNLEDLKTKIDSTDQAEIKSIMDKIRTQDSKISSNSKDIKNVFSITKSSISQIEQLNTEIDKLKNKDDDREFISSVTKKEITIGYHIIAGSYSSKENAEKQLKQFQSEGFTTSNIQESANGLYRIFLESFKNKDEAIIKLNKLKASGKSIWLPANKALITDILRKKDLKSYFGVSEILTPDLVFLIEMILRKKILNSISMTKKAGDLAIGLDAIKTQLMRREHCLIVVAMGAKSLSDKSFFSSKNVSIFESLLEQKDLEKSTGKNNIKYVGIFSKNFKKTIQVDLNKLKGFIDNH